MSTDTSQNIPVDNKTRIAAVVLVVLCLFSQNLATFGVALFLPDIQKDLGASFTQGGSLAAILLLVYALMQIPAGFLADRFGRKKVFVVGMLGVTVLSLAFGLVQSYEQAMANQALNGLFRSLLFATGMALLARWFSPQRRATAMALYSLGMFSGQVIFYSVAPLLAAISSWRLPFIVFSAAGIIISAAYLWLGREPATTGSHMVKLSEMFRLLRYRIMWYCNVIQYVRLALLQGIAFWLPTLLVSDKGLTLQVTGLIIALRYVFMGPANMLGSYISDRIKNHTLIIGISLVFMAITTVLIVEVDNLALLIAIIMLNAIFVQFYFGPLFAIPVEVLGPTMTATTTGVGNFFANLGAFTFALLLGALKDATGSFDAGFYAMAGACLVALVFTILLAKVNQKQNQPATV